MLNVAVIGSNGFIGSHLVNALEQLFGVNKFLFGKGSENLLNNNLPYSQIDLKNNEMVAKHFHSIDVVYDLASAIVPLSSWETGSNENFNGLVRDYLPKKTNFAEVTDEQVKNISEELNQIPRKRFDFLSPSKVFNLLIKKVAFKT
jgi:aspartate-semialdehyde dehydrogenase